MDDSSKDLPKPPRRSAARPFLSPRQSSGEGSTGPLELSRRRAAQLFTPPGSSPPTPRLETSRVADAEVAAQPAPPAASHAEVDFDRAWAATTVSSPERTPDADSRFAGRDPVDDGGLVVEMFEPEDIELTAAASTGPDEHSIEVIAYDDANSLLRAAAADGKHPRVDGLQLETTEFSFEQEAPPPRMSVDSFWAIESLARTNDVKSHDAAESKPVEIERADETESAIDEETAQEPMHASEPSGQPYADIAPPWRNRGTPVSSQALEELKESEPWDLTSSDALESIPEEIEASAPAAELSQVHAEPPGNSVADALERIAARVRAGELEVSAATEMSDEATLSAVLTSLLRLRR
jgi:hypothetical protein